MTALKSGQAAMPLQELGSIADVHSYWLMRYCLAVTYLTEWSDTFEIQARQYLTAWTSMLRPLDNQVRRCNSSSPAQVSSTLRSSPSIMKVNKRSPRVRQRE